MKRTIEIEVYGGVASVTKTHKDTTVVIHDHDNKRTYKNVDGQNLVSTPLKRQR